MSQENVEIVRAAYDAYNREDLDAALQHAAPDSELDWSRGVGPNAGVYKLDQMRSFFEDFADTFESVRVEPDEFIDAGDHVVVPQTGYIRGREGVEATARVSLVWTCREGAIVRICLYQQKREALEAVGLAKQGMSEENVAILRRTYEAASRGDWDAAFEAAEPEFELVPPDQSPDSAPVRGVQEVKAWFADQQETVGDLSIEVEKLIEAEEFIVALIRLRIRPHGADADFELRIAHLWALREGKLIRCEIFPERDKALEAAGLSE